jgi:hypothetical protein
MCRSHPTVQNRVTFPNYLPDKKCIAIYRLKIYAIDPANQYHLPSALHDGLTQVSLFSTSQKITTHIPNFNTLTAQEKNRLTNTSSTSTYLHNV